jgi:hypothetical protein
MSDWPFYFALLILILLINIKITEPNAELIRDVQNSISYGENSLDTENTELVKDIKKLAEERHIDLERDKVVRGDIDKCVSKYNEVQGLLDAEKERLKTCDSELITAKANVNKCNTEVGTINGKIVDTNIKAAETQKAIEECNYLLQNGPRPVYTGVGSGGGGGPGPGGGSNKATDAISAQRDAIAAKNAANPKYSDYYTRKLDTCNVQLNQAQAGYSDRHRPRPRPFCVIL